MAGGGGVGPTEPGFLDLPTFTLAAVLAFFLICSTAFEKSTHWLIYFLKKRKRNGLAQAVSNLVLELTLVGLVSLLLIVVQQPVSEICVAYTPGPYTHWNLISNVDGCDCCLSHTTSVSTCFLEDRSCGPGFCNCDNKNATCLDTPSLPEILAEWQADLQCKGSAEGGSSEGGAGGCSACVEEYAQRVLESSEVELALQALTPKCDGAVPDKKQCGPGKAPLITITALHQIHIFIFVIAMTHVVLGCIMIVLSSWRLRRWRQQCRDEDDGHAQGVRQMLDGQSGRWTRLLHSLSRHRHSQKSTPQTPRSPTLLAAAANGSTGAGAGARGAGEAGTALPEGNGGLSIKVVQPGSPVASARAAGADVAAQAAAAAVALDGSSTGRADQSKLLKGSSSGSLPGSLAAAAVQDGRQQTDGAAAGGEPAPPAPPPLPPPQLLPAGSTGSEAGVQVRYGGINMLAPVASQQLTGSMLPPVELADAELADGDADSKVEAESEAEGKAGKAASTQGRSMATLARSHSIKGDDYAGWLQEYLTCLLHLLKPAPVAAEELRLMRASFTLTHRVPAGFDFWGYISASMEDDFAQIVGVGWEMWTTMVLFVLISGPLGWAAVLFLALAAVVLVVVNVKLLQIIRHVCRGCRVNHLSSNIFWFSRPPLLLHPIKYVLFLVSFLFGSVIFFVWSFGAESCPFTASGNRFWWGWVLPWWTVLIFSAVIFLDAATRTLPIYSLAVQMGSEFKHHMLPKGVREKLLLISERIKKKHKARQRAEEGSRKASG